MESGEFKLGEPFFPYFRRVALGRFLPFLVIAIVAAVLITASREEMDPSMMLVFGGIMAMVIGIGGWRGLKQQEANLRELRIRLDEGSIRRTQPGLPELTIPKEQIRRIVRVPGKGLTVFGTGRQQILGIPEFLEGFAVVENVLEGWHAFEVRKPGLSTWLGLLALIGTLAAFVALYVSTSKTVVTACGGGLLALMIYSAIALRGSPHVDKRTQRFVWFLPVIILVIAVRIWMVWAQ